MQLQSVLWNCYDAYEKTLISNWPSFPIWQKAFIIMYVHQTSSKNFQKLKRILAPITERIPCLLPVEKIFGLYISMCDVQWVEMSNSRTNFKHYMCCFTFRERWLCPLLYTREEFAAWIADWVMNAVENDASKRYVSPFNSAQAQTSLQSFAKSAAI